MSKRFWKHLQQGTTYKFTPGNGWSFTTNGDGSVSLSYGGSAAAVASADLTVDPDPGQGGDVPPM